MDDSISALSVFALLPPAARPAGPASAAALRTMLTNSVPSGHTRRAYAKAFDDLLALAVRTGQPISRIHPAVWLLCSTCRDRFPFNRRARATGSLVC